MTHLRRIAFTATLLAGLIGACSQPAPVAKEQTAEADQTKAAAPDKLPADVPIPIGLEGRRDSTQPGSGFFVVQGQIRVSLPEAVTSFRAQAEDGGWKLLNEPSLDDSVMTLTLEKESRSLKVTMVKAENSVTNVNLMTGPK